FKYVKNSIAMGNSCEEIKDIASFVTEKSNEDGIEYACKYFGWI
ncbi:HAD hydrolase family protein, partial [Klebsiella pneumoniae]|nr:HAD hydrolase family protein [Klebsiella pneumoniae]